MHVVIDRTKWGRTEQSCMFPFGNTNGQLLNPYTRKMCCLGFVCLQLGASEEDIEELAYPYEIAYKFYKTDKKEIVGLIDFYHLQAHEGTSPVYSNNSLSKSAAIINDDPKTTDAQKEEALIKIFSDNGHSIEFIN